MRIPPNRELAGKEKTSNFLPNVGTCRICFQLLRDIESILGGICLPKMALLQIPTRFLRYGTLSGWWFQIFFIFIPTWGRFPF